MTYHFDRTEINTHLWPPGVGQGYDFFRRQDIYKTNPGTKRSETPYLLQTSSYTSGSKTHADGVTPPVFPGCRGTGSQSINGIVQDDVYSLKPRALNRARQAFIQACREGRETSIGASLGELDQALRMIGDRASQLLNFARNLRRGRFRRAASVLGFKIPPKTVTKLKRAKSLGDQWLEFHFGWVPLLGDIHDGMRLISEPLSNDGPCRGRGRASERLVDRVVYEFSDSAQINKRYVSGHFEALAELRGDTKLENPNLDLLQNLGVINPVSVAWELVPFSFLVDHVVDIGSFLNSFSDELGWECVNLGQSTLSVCRGGSEKSKTWNGDMSELRQSYIVTGNAAVMLRSFPTALPPYTLEFRNPFTGLSAPRAATYIALLLQQM